MSDAGVRLQAVNHQVDYAGDTSDPGSALTLRGLTEPLGGPMSTDATSVVKPAQQLYRLFDADGELLYIGISYSALARIGQHKASQPWWHEVKRIMIDNHECSRPEMLDIERKAITRERPRYNVIHRGIPVKRGNTTKWFHANPKRAATRVDGSRWKDMCEKCGESLVPVHIYDRVGLTQDLKKNQLEMWYHCDDCGHLWYTIWAL